MDSGSIKAIIYKEIKDLNDITNVNGFDLTKCIVDPILETYESSSDSEMQYDLWTVFEEEVNLSGSRIYYDEDEEMFGVAKTGDQKQRIDIGHVGSFLETLEEL